MLKKIIFMIVISSSSFASFTDIFSSDKISDPIIELVELEYERIIKDPRGSKFLADIKARGDLTAYYDITTQLITDECRTWQPNDFFYRISMYDTKLAEELGIAYKEIQKNYCGKLEEYNEYFVKNILNEFNDDHETNISFDDIDGTSELVKLGIKKDKIPLWEKNGITKKEISNWAKANVITLDEALEWKKYNYTINNVSSWKMNGISTPKEAAKWGSLDDYFTCGSYQQTDINVVMAWRKVNIPCSKINALVSVGITPESFLKWKALGITDSSRIGLWKSKGFTTPESVEVWVSKGISDPYEIQDWINEGFTTSEEVAKWRSMGINTARETRGWFQNTSVKNVDDVMVWVNAGISKISDIVLWRTEVGVVDVETILSWKSIGAKNPYAAAKMKRNGVTPPKSSPSVDSRIEKSRPSNSSKNVPEKRRSAGRTITAKGIIIFATLDSAIEINDGADSIGFLTDSEIGNKIFSICKVGEYCEITGVVNNKFFLSVSKVQIGLPTSSVKKADTTTDYEQSNSLNNYRVFEAHNLVNTKNLNVRSGNGRDHEIVGVLNEYDEIIVGGCIEAHYGDDVWCEVRPNRPYNKFVGWVNSDFIEGKETKKQSYKIINIPINDTLTLRQGNSTKTKKVADLARTFSGFRLQMCAINAQNQEWCKMKHYDLKGWVMKKYVTPAF